MDHSTNIRWTDQWRSAYKKASRDHHPEIQKDFRRRALRAERRVVPKPLVTNMVVSFSQTGVDPMRTLWRVLTWPARVVAARRTMADLARMSEYELRDIGLTPSDINDATALPLDADPSALLVKRRAWRDRSATRRDLAA
jgi:uncharacterized protein YjiS (DUF1127 family)